MREMCSLHQGQPLTLKWVDSEGSPGHGRQGRVSFRGSEAGPALRGSPQLARGLSWEEAGRPQLGGRGQEDCPGLGCGPVLTSSPDCPFPDWGLFLWVFWKGESLHFLRESGQMTAAPIPPSASVRHASREGLLLRVTLAAAGSRGHREPLPAGTASRGFCACLCSPVQRWTAKSLSLRAGTDLRTFWISPKPGSSQT